MSAQKDALQSSVSELRNDDRFMRFPAIIDGKINTEQFLYAAQGVVRMVDKFGKLFAPVKYDMQGNIDKLNSKYATDKEKHSTLQDMILSEKTSGQNLIATDALMWLRRGLHMIHSFFEKIVEDHKIGKATEDLVAFLKKSYKEALEPYHGWMAQQLFGLLSRMVPTRTQLLQALADERGDKEEALLKEMEIFLAGLREILQNLVAFYNEHGLENNAKV